MIIAAYTTHSSHRMIIYVNHSLLLDDFVDGYEPAGWPKENIEKINRPRFWQSE